MSKRRWYHWLALVLFALLAASIGLLNLTMGASTDSPYFVADNILVRAIGLAFVISSVLMILRRRIGYLIAAACFLLSGLELVVTWSLGQPIAGVAVLVLVAAFVLLAGVAMWSGKVLAKA